MLTVEHILPKAAGGGEPAKIYTGEELMKTLGAEAADEAIKYINQQNGYVAYTLCKLCNNNSGALYDEDFSHFYNFVRSEIYKIFKTVELKDSETLNEYLSKKGIGMKLKGVKPLNIAKRVLVAFTSVEHAGLTNRIPEIRKAILDKNYKPDVSGFSLYMTPHYGNDGYFGTVASMIKGGDGQYYTQAYAGIELGPIAFYLTPKDEHLKGGALKECLDITSWLEDYNYDELVDFEIHANFMDTLGLKFNIPV